MTDLIEFESKYRKLDPTDLSDALKYLCDYGNPFIHKMKRGWHANMEMFVSGKGVEFEIKSEFDNKSPEKAVEQLIERMIETLNKLKS